MSYNRSQSIDASQGGDTVKQAILDLDDDMDNIFTYLNTHETTASAIHGVTGSIVGTSDTQTLTNKTLTAPDINGGTVDAITALTIANNVDIGDYQLRAKQFYADVAIGTAPLVITSTTMVDNLNADMLDGQDAPAGTIVGTTDTQTLTNKTLTSPTINGGTISSPTITTPSLTLQQGATPAPTTEGDIQWDTDDDRIVIGDGVGQKIFSDDSVSSGIHGVTGSFVGTTDTQTLTNKTLTSPVLNTGVSGTAIKDEDNMVSDSDSHLATQQSIKAYVDAAALASIPSSEIILFDKNTVVTGYTLLTGVDDKLLFITKGSAAGGQTGGANHTTGTWTQPDHTLTESEMPSHRHRLVSGTGNNSSCYGLGDASADSIAGGGFASPTWYDQSYGGKQLVENTGGGSGHNHGSTWRPAARCMTRQQRN